MGRFSGYDVMRAERAPYKRRAMVYATIVLVVPDRVRFKKSPLKSGPFRSFAFGGSAEIAAEALDALAGILEVGGLGRIGDAEGRPEAEG